MGKKKISILHTLIFRGIILTLLFGVIAFIIWLVTRPPGTPSGPSGPPGTPSGPGPGPPGTPSGPGIFNVTMVMNEPTTQQKDYGYNPGSCSEECGKLDPKNATIKDREIIVFFISNYTASVDLECQLKGKTSIDENFNLIIKQNNISINIPFKSHSQKYLQDMGFYYVYSFDKNTKEYSQFLNIIKNFQAGNKTIQINVESPPTPSPPQPKGNLADQLYNAGVRMFGAGECPHTQQQLKNLGYNVQNPINPATAPKFYVQCSESLNVDNLSQIKGECISLFQTCSGTTCNYHAQYPTWQFGVGGKVISGILPIDVLMNFISKNRDKNYTVQSILSIPLEKR